MNITFTKEIIIQSDQSSTWEALRQPGFAKDFLPEIKKDLQGMGDYIRRTHPNAALVAPDYVVPGFAMGWSAGAGTAIRLPRKDVDARIESVDIRVDSVGSYTKVTIEVNYSPDLGKHFFLASHCVRGLFSMKLDVLKKDLENSSKQIDWMPAFS